MSVSRASGTPWGSVFWRFCVFVSKLINYEARRNLLQNERLESFWDALWLGIWTFLCFTMKLQEYQWKSKKISENQRKSTKIKENQRKSTKIDENQWKSTKINENQRKSMKIDENQRKSTKINENQRKSTSINEYQRKSTNINDFSATLGSLPVTLGSLWGHFRSL